MAPERGSRSRPPRSSSRRPGGDFRDVFSPEGEWLSEVVVRARVVRVSSDRAYGVRIDEMDVKHVVVYEIQRGGE